MKFLCPECKAKYQIPDEKIAGRTLRMKCRRCEHDIVVKGDPDALDSAQPQEEARPPSGRPAAAIGRKPSEPALRTAKPGTRGGSGAGPLPKGTVPAKGSALGADFRKNVAHGAPEAPRASVASPLDAWHVSINDVPVGPMRREELGRKIQTGAVTGDSLCWREGYDDWRPLKDTELASLLQRRLPPPRPAPGPPPPRGATTSRGSSTPGRPGIAPAPRSPAARPAPGTAPSRTAAAVPAARSNVVPIGGRLGAAAAPTFDEPDSFEEDEATSIAQSPFEEMDARPSAPDAAALGALAATSTAPVKRSPSVPPSAMSPAPQRAPAVFPAAPITMDAPVVRRSPGLPIGAWMGIAFFGMGGAAAVVFVGLYMSGYLRPPQAPIATNDVAPPPVAPLVPTQHIDVAPTNPPVVTPTDTVDTNPTATNDTPSHHVTGTFPVKHGPPATGTGTTNPGTKLSAADRAALAALAADGVGASPTQIPHQVAHPDDSQDTTGPEMSADQLRGVVNNGRPQLQHCYELVARQTGSTDAMRVQVHITVGGSGVITRVAATGNADALNTCIEREVRRWHFPGGGEADFPLVFQPGGG